MSLYLGVGDKRDYGGSFVASVSVVVTTEKIQWKWIKIVQCMYKTL